MKTGPPLGNMRLPSVVPVPSEIADYRDRLVNYNMGICTGRDARSFKKHAQTHAVYVVDCIKDRAAKRNEKIINQT